jgi:hypothetical protein
MCRRTLALYALVIAAAVGGARGARAADWNAAMWQDESTLDFRTTAPDDGEHWSRVWLVVIDGEVYLRLGSRAADRITKNQAAPIVGIRIAGQQFDSVRAEAVDEKADAEAAAMADKSWTDIFERYFSHPLTIRLAPQQP